MRSNSSKQRWALAARLGAARARVQVRASWAAESQFGSARRQRLGWGARWLCVAALVLATTLPSGEAAATPAELGRKLAVLAQAQGAARYTALRELWMSWERVDPAQVEQILAAAGADRAFEPPVRAYARLLAAYARRRRGDLAGATRAIEGLGYISDWLVVGPFDNENKSGFDSILVPERELGQPVVLDRSYQGKEQAVRWRRSPDVHRYGWLDLSAMLRPDSYVCALATTYLRDAAGSDRARPLSLWVGTSGSFKLYWNSELVLRDGAYRQLDADRLAVPVSLHPGTNRLTVKVCGDDSPLQLALRVAEPDGAPARGLQVAATVEASLAAASQQRLRQPAPAAPPAGPGSTAVAPSEPEAEPATEPTPAVWSVSTDPRNGRGPVQRFEAELAARPNDAALMEQYARYLKVTGGDPAASHQARDLARRSAEAEPTVARLLLAGSLAEDRNQQRRWVTAARQQAKQPEEQVDALLAEARLARTGAHWQDAVPLYDRVLEIDPDNVPATLGKVDLYVEAGLKRTALATLERASLAQPHSVALLRALAGQLRALGRDTEADEVEARYASLRFDDGGVLKQRIDQAVARGDGARARRWCRRLLQSDPASAWAHGVVARALRALGDEAGAVATYGRGLAVAPDDVTLLRALSELQGEAGRRAEQVALLERILRLQPQAKGVRAYLEHIEPGRAHDDERYAWEPERFLAERAAPDTEHARRTLRKLTVTTLLSNGLARRFHQVVFQPLTDAAAALSRQYTFPYHADRQFVEVTTAKVYRADGSVDEAIERGTASADDPSLRMYTLQRTYYVQFPRLEVGDVVELRYRVEDVAALGDSAEAFGEIEYLQAAEPVHDVEYVVVAPKSRSLHLSASTLKGLRRDERMRSDHRIIRFHAKHVPAIRPEPHMPPWPELAAHVHVSSFASWQALGRWYWGLAREQLDVDDEVRRRTREIVAGLGSDREKVAAVYAHAANETRYVALELGIEGIRPRRAALTLARGWGDCKDKAALIISMLRELGIDAHMVVVRSGLRGRFATDTASLAPFDHAVVYVPSLDLYLDGTAQAAGTGELPGPVRGALGLRIAPQGATIVDLPEPAASASVERRRFELKVDKEGRIRFVGKLSNQGVTAPGWRQRYQAESTRRERVVRDLGTDFGQAELLPGPTGLTLSQLEQLEEPVRLEVRGTASAHREGGKVSVIVGPSYRLAAQYASLAKRQHDLLVGPRRTLEEEWVLDLRPGQTVSSLPTPVKVSTRFGSFERAVQRTGQRVVVRTRLTLEQPRVEPDQYERWRRFVTQVDSAAGPRVVVVP